MLRPSCAAEAPPSGAAPPPPVYTLSWAAPKPSPSLRTQLSLRFGSLRAYRGASQATLETAILDAWATGTPQVARRLQPQFLAQASLQDGAAALRIGQAALRARDHDACLPPLELALASGALHTSQGMQALTYAYVACNRLGAARTLLRDVARQRPLDAVLTNELGYVSLFIALQQPDGERFAEARRTALTLFTTAHHMRPHSAAIEQNLRVAQALRFGAVYGAPASQLPPLKVEDGTAVLAAVRAGLTAEISYSTRHVRVGCTTINGQVISTVTPYEVWHERAENKDMLQRLACV